MLQLQRKTKFLFFSPSHLCVPLIFADQCKTGSQCCCSLIVFEYGVTVITDHFSGSSKAVSPMSVYVSNFSNFELNDL